MVSTPPFFVETSEERSGLSGSKQLAVVPVKGSSYFVDGASKLVPLVAEHKVADCLPGTHTPPFVDGTTVTNRVLVVIDDRRVEVNDAKLLKTAWAELKTRK